MRHQFIGLLSTAQALLLFMKWIAILLSRDMSWFVVLTPVWLLLGAGATFWALFGLVVHWVD